MVAQVGVDLELDVRQRAHGQRHALARQACHQRRIVDGAHAVVDALHLEDVECVGDVLRRTFLARVGHQVQAQLTRLGKYARELLGRVALLGRIQAHADKAVAVGQRRFQRGEGVFLRQMAQEAQDQAAGEVIFGARLGQGIGDAVDHHADGHAARGMGLRIEEDLGVADVVGDGALDVVHGHVEEIFLGQQHAGAGVVDVQERLQVGKGVGGAQRLDAGVGQRHLVALRQPEDQFRFKRAFDMHMQFGLGSAADLFRERGIDGHGGLVSGHFCACRRGRWHGFRDAPPPGGPDAARQGAVRGPGAAGRRWLPQS
ncbi:hypothetical protein D9M72_381320 [compost metagenome]